jgi:hypothetical protein
MGLFGGRGDDGDRSGTGGRGDAAAQLEATRQRLDAMPLEQFAEELLRSTFGDDTPAQVQARSMPEVLAPFDPTGSGQFAGLPHALWRDVELIVAEALQHLEHRGLVVMGVTSGSYTYLSFRLTRAGRSHLGL